MTNATVGRRPDGPGYHWRRINDSDHGEPCLVYQALDGAYNVKFIDDERAHRLDDMPGTFTLLSAPAAMPLPDWSQAPPWANWWAVEYAAGEVGLAYWFANKPITDYAEWVDSVTGERGILIDTVDLPLGVDWRTTLRRRPEVQSE